MDHPVTTALPAQHLTPLDPALPAQIIEAPSTTIPAGHISQPPAADLSNISQSVSAIPKAPTSRRTRPQRKSSTEAHRPSMHAISNISEASGAERGMSRVVSGSGAKVRRSRMSGPADEPRLTPTTGRVSKAKKGKRVHACEYADCPKVSCFCAALCNIWLSDVRSIHERNIFEDIN
jgi:hypothetical protein